MYCQCSLPTAIYSKGSILQAFCIQCSLSTVILHCTVSAKGYICQVLCLPRKYCQFPLPSSMSAKRSISQVPCLPSDIYVCPPTVFTRCYVCQALYFPSPMFTKWYLCMSSYSFYPLLCLPRFFVCPVSSYHVLRLSIVILWKSVKSTHCHVCQVLLQYTVCLQSAIYSGCYFFLPGFLF